MIQNNPFTTTKYRSKLYFCDREEEVKDICSALDNGRNITLHAIRRMGKTGLIHRVFEEYEVQKEVICIYAEVLSTESKQDFINELITQVLNTIESTKEGILKRASKFFSQYSPKFGVNPLHGTPTIELSIQSDAQFDASMDTLFSTIAETTDRRIILAIDEYQKINDYDDGSISAVIRRHLQSIPHLSMVFSGSEQHLLIEMFASPQHPLYQMTQLYPLGRIDHDKYHDFIKFHFKQGMREISSEVINHILDWTMLHTVYVQILCNRLYSLGASTITMDDCRKVQAKILKENETFYYKTLKMMTKNQQRLLTAIAKDEMVSQPTSASFIQRHALGAHSSVSQSLKTLLSHQFLYQEVIDRQEVYRVYDVFFMRWLRVW